MRLLEKPTSRKEKLIRNEYVDCTRRMKQLRKDRSKIREISRTIKERIPNHVYYTTLSDDLISEKTKPVNPDYFQLLIKEQEEKEKVQEQNNREQSVESKVETIDKSPQPGVEDSTPSTDTGEEGKASNAERTIKSISKQIIDLQLIDSTIRTNRPGVYIPLLYCYSKPTIAKPVRRGSSLGSYSIFRKIPSISLSELEIKVDQSRMKGVRAQSCPLSYFMHEFCMTITHQGYSFCSHGFTNHPDYMTPLNKPFCYPTGRKGAIFALKSMIKKGLDVRKLKNGTCIPCVVQAFGQRLPCEFKYVFQGAIYCSHGYTNHTNPEVIPYDRTIIPTYPGTSIQRITNKYITQCTVTVPLLFLYVDRLISEGNRFHTIPCDRLTTIMSMNEFEELKRTRTWGMCPMSYYLSEKCSVVEYRKYRYCAHGYTDDPQYTTCLAHRFCQELPSLSIVNMELNKRNVYGDMRNLVNCNVIKCKLGNESARINCNKQYILQGYIWCSHGYTNKRPDNKVAIESYMGGPTREEIRPREIRRIRFKDGGDFHQTKCSHGFENSFDINTWTLKRCLSREACLQRCNAGVCDYNKDLHVRECPKINIPRRIWRSMNPNLVNQNYMQRVLNDLKQKATVRLGEPMYKTENVKQLFRGMKREPRLANMNNKTRERFWPQNKRYNKNPYVAGAIHTNPEVLPKSILKRHNERYPYNTTADSRLDLH